jgi:hemoglobin-like flavoprotein
MSPQQIALLRGSWALVQPAAGPVAELFYNRLFQLDPSLRPLFRGDLAQQGHKLMAALAFVVEGLDDLPQHLPAVQALARRHAGYGVQPDHYDTVGRALLWTLAHGLGEAATDDVLQAWRQAYALLAGVMIEAAWPARLAATEWQAQAG